VLGNLYWSIVVLAVGGCIGSFLNVVIYRWPRSLSIRQPARSFCPACKTSIAWCDNIPVLSYVLLRGRCRHCGCAISLQYPLVELATALVFLMTYDALFVAGLREGVCCLQVDWPILIGHWVLYGGLIALSVMDLEAYMVDVRVTWLITLVGLAAHTLWTPASSMTHAIAFGQVHDHLGVVIRAPSASEGGASPRQEPGACASGSDKGDGGWIRPGVVQAGMALGATVGLLVGAWLFLRGRTDLLSEGQEPVEEALPEGLSPDRALNWRWLWLIPLLALLCVYQVAMLTDRGSGGPAPAWPAAPSDSMVGPYPLLPLAAGTVRLGLGLLAGFIALAWVAGQPQPQADAEIMEAIESEAGHARGNALSELKLLSPAILLGTAILVVLLTETSPKSLQGIGQVLHWSPVGQWQPLYGLATGLTGWIIGGAIGWLARIVFTLVFGKEALGMGDVHILAAAGAVAGWPVAIIGFFLAAPLALLAIVVICIRRQSRALPYGPWLALAFFAAGLFQDRILRYFHVRWILE